jgi:hypothetical protein
MLAIIISHTPVWVWLLLAFLIYRGVSALSERPLLAGNVLPLPVILTVWGLVSMYNRYGNDFGVMACWAFGYIAAFVIGCLSVTQNAVRGTREAPRQAGSVVPLLLILSIFVVKYSVEVSFGFHPEIVGASPVSNCVALVYGGLAGLMAGRVLRFFERARRLPCAPGPGSEIPNASKAAVLPG